MLADSVHDYTLTIRERVNLGVSETDRAQKERKLRWKMEAQSPSTALWRLEKPLWVGNLPIVWNTGSSTPEACTEP